MPVISPLMPVPLYHCFIVEEKPLQVARTRLLTDRIPDTKKKSFEH